MALARQAIQIGTARQIRPGGGKRSAELLAEGSALELIDPCQDGIRVLDVSQKPESIPVRSHLRRRRDGLQANLVADAGVRPVGENPGGGPLDPEVVVRKGADQKGYARIVAVGH